MVKIKASWW